MASLRKQLLKVNLLINQGNPPKLAAKLFRWALSSGRYIVMIIELVVVLGFAARYKFDEELSDLHDNIAQQVPYMQSLRGDELLIKTTQFQLANIKKNKSEQPNWAKTMTKIAQVTPKNTKLQNISFDRVKAPGKTTLSIIGQSASNAEISAFVKALQKDPYFAGVSLSSSVVEKSQVIFSISGVLTPTANK